MLFGIAPSKLHGSRGADGRTREVVRDDTSRDRTAIHEYLYARSPAGTVVSEEDVLPCAVEWEGSDRRRRGSQLSESYPWAVLLARRFLSSLLRRFFGFVLLGRFCLGFLLFRRLVRRQILLAQVLRRGIVERLLGFGLFLVRSLFRRFLSSAPAASRSFGIWFTNATLRNPSSAESSQPRSCCVESIFEISVPKLPG